MRIHNLTRFYPVLIILVAIAVSSCVPRATATPTAASEANTVLQLVGPNGGRVLSMADLKALPVTEGQAGIKSSTGQITIPEAFKGVSLKDLVSAIGGTFDPSMGVSITAEDGYSMTFSYDQVMNGSFIAYNPANGAEISTHDPLTAIIAYEHNGQPLNLAEEGTLRLAVVSATNKQVVDGHWSVKWVNKVEVKPVGQAWSLDLQGAISSPVARDSFQSCGSPSCHGTSWMDENGQNWVGVPMWLMVGEVDDANSHDDNAYNRELADSGYTVDIVGADGYTVTLDSQAIKDDNDLLVAFMVNDGDLPSQYYPLRLVGTHLASELMVGQITRIVVNVPQAPAAAVVPLVDDTGQLIITGLVDKELTLTDAGLKAMPVTTINAVGKNGPEDFQGILLNTLLDNAGLKTGAVKLVFTASDGYSSEVNLSEVRACPNSLLAFTDTPGSYTIVLPDLPTSAWAKYVTLIEVK